MDGYKHANYKYFAPELLMGQKYSKSADFWAVGVTLLEIMGIRKKPYVGENTETILEEMRTEKPFLLKNKDIPTGWSK